MEKYQAAEAFQIAQEMEKRAIRIYERALMLFGDDPQMRRHLEEVLAEEREHLKTFESWGAEIEQSLCHKALLSARAADALFTGGLVEAQRKGAFESPKALLEYALSEENESKAYYEDLSRKLRESGETQVADALMVIAAEEGGHACVLNSRLDEAENI